MDFLDKLRNKSEHEKKIIIWAALIIIGLIFLLLWVYNSKKAIGGLKAEDIMEQVNFPSKEEIPQMEEPSEEDMRQLEELMKQLQEENAQ